MKQVAKLIIIDDKQRYLMLTRSNHPIFGKDPDIPGGTLDHEESLLQTVVREVYEETRIVIDASTIEKLYQGSEYSVVGTLYVLYKVSLDSTPDIQLSWEHSSYEWLDRKSFLDRAQGANDTFMHMVYDQLK